MAPAAAFLAGVTTSFGPCAAPRFLAICSIAGTGSRLRRVLAILAFLGGIALGTLLLAFGAAQLAAVARASSWVYGALAIALGVTGFKSLIEADRFECGHHVRSSSAGSAFFLGAAMTLVISPCCTPIVVTLAAAAASAGRALAILLVIAFLLGHLLPLIAASVGINQIRGALANRSLAMPARVVGGAVTLAMAGYYAILL